MFIETRFYDNDISKARYLKNYSNNKNQANSGETNKYDFYIDKADSLQDWIEENLTIEPDDIAPLAHKLDGGGWVDIAEYIN